MRESANERKRFIGPEGRDKAIYREGGDVSNGSSGEAFFPWEPLECAWEKCSASILLQE